MTDYTDITAREPETQTSASELIAFFRVRNNDETRFFPGTGSTLHFANRDSDTASLKSVIPGFLTYGDSVKVTYKAVTVFLGSVERIVDRRGAGSERAQDVTCVGPWGRLARMVFRQGWYNGSDYSDFSKVILNQYQDGTPINLNRQLELILDGAKDVCGFTRGTVSVSTLKLPYDETRDISVADAIRRELRFFPKAVARFDYAAATPALHIVRGADTAADASYVATVKKTERTYEYTAHPITGVDIEIEATGTVQGVEYRSISHQTAGDVEADNIDCLHATLPIEGGSSNTVHAAMDCTTEDIPPDLNDAAWWKKKHPRLAKVPVGQISITNAERSGAADAANYPRIAASTVGEIEEAGLRAREEKFTCKCKITESYEEEEDILLTMNFVTTNARTRKYTWVASSEASSGQTVPAGLAAAILADRCGNLRNESMVVRLGAATEFPKLGDRCDNLFLQSFDVDCADLTAALNFGQPEYLSVEDMAGLLSGFRNRGSSSSSVSRGTGKKEDEGKELELGGIPPVSSTEFAPGSKTKAAIMAADGTGSSIKFDSTGSGGNVDVKTSALASGETIAAHTIKWIDDAGTEQIKKILATADITIPKGGSDQVQSNWGETDSSAKSFIKNKPPTHKITLTDGQSSESAKSATFYGVQGENDLAIAIRKIVGGPGINVDLDGNDIKITNTREGGGGGGTEGYTGDVTFLDGFKYDKTAKKLMCRFGTAKVEKGLIVQYTAGTEFTEVEGGQAVEETV